MKTRGQHPGRMSGGVIFMSLLFYMFQNILNIFFLAFLGGEKLFPIFQKFSGEEFKCKRSHLLDSRHFYIHLNT